MVVLTTLAIQCEPILISLPVLLGMLVPCQLCDHVSDITGSICGSSGTVGDSGVMSMLDCVRCLVLLLVGALVLL